jgi:CDP-glycerol glycerophosphotransferase (TagB/SpsB family)
MKNIVLFGAGTGGHRAYKALKSKYRIVAFIDNDRKKHGQSIKGVTIQSPASLGTLEFDFIYIASMYFASIHAQLTQDHYISAKKIRIVEPNILSGLQRSPISDSIARILSLIRGAILKHTASAIRMLTPKAAPVWLIGELRGTTARDNGIAFFAHLMKENRTNCYFVLSNHATDKVPADLPSEHMVKRNSLRHYILFQRSTYNIVTHGFRDTTPGYYLHSPETFNKDIIFLDHGVILYKKLFWHNQSYNKSIVRFVASSTREKEIIAHEMMPTEVRDQIAHSEMILAANQALQQEPDNPFIRYVAQNIMSPAEAQTSLAYYSKLIGIERSRVHITGLPRFDKLMERSKTSQTTNTILFFFTWRDELSVAPPDEFKSSTYFKKLIQLLNNQMLQELLSKHHYKIKFLCHVEMKQQLPYFTSMLINTQDIQVAETHDLQREILAAKALVTDYSSLSWDFRYLNKPVFFYQFDAVDYNKTRGSYANSPADWCGYVSDTENGLIANLKELIENHAYQPAPLDPKVDFLHRDQSHCARVLQMIEDIGDKNIYAGLQYIRYWRHGTVCHQSGQQPLSQRQEYRNHQPLSHRRHPQTRPAPRHQGRKPHRQKIND